MSSVTENAISFSHVFQYKLRIRALFGHRSDPCQYAIRGLEEKVIPCLIPTRSQESNEQ